MKRMMLVLVLVLLAACGSEEPAHHDSAPHDSAPHAGGGGTSSFGSPGDPSEADRTIELSAVDPLKFSPASLTVEQGETVTFEITNEGSTDHEFVLGDDSYHRGHGPQMGDMGHSEGNGVFLEPGATDSVTWTFDEPGEVLYACHVNGHFEAGMFGRIQVR